MPALVAGAPSRPPTNPGAKSGHTVALTASLSHLTVQDAELNTAARPAPSAEPVPRLRREPRHHSERLADPDRKPPAAALPAKESPEVRRPPIAAKPAPKEPNDSPRADPHDHRVMTARKIVQLRTVLRLLPDQVGHWGPVEAILREIGREQIAQLKRGGKPEVGTGLMMRLYYAAQPLLGTLRPDQKERVRAMARSLGYGSVASML